MLKIRPEEGIAMLVSGAASLAIMPALAIWDGPIFQAKTVRGDVLSFLHRFNIFQY